jgi:hypothetical protein
MRLSGESAEELMERKRVAGVGEKAGILVFRESRPEWPDLQGTL